MARQPVCTYLTRAGHEVRGKEPGWMESGSYPAVQGLYSVDAVLYPLEGDTDNLAIHDAGLDYLAVQIVQLRELIGNVLLKTRECS